MRVISGKLKGRNILGFNISGTRPTMDRVKESVFSMIQNNLLNAVCLDLFSGSGNLGIEALSNGAKLVYFNDYNKICVKTIQKNLETFLITKDSIVTNYDYHDALVFYKKEKLKFDIVFLDPPYKKHIVNEILEYLVLNNMLNNEALIICEVDTKEEFLNKELNLIKEKKYGDKIILIYKYGN